MDKISFGDLVRIKSKSEIDMPYAWDMSHEMEKYCGMTARVTDCDVAVSKDGRHHDVIYLDVDHGIFFWHECFLEKIKE